MVITMILPRPIELYFAADNGNDLAALAACLADDATVLDEARTHRGLAAIKRWKTETKRKYSYTIEPLAAEQHGEITAVKGKVSGNFPGSPVLIEFCFRLSGDKIASLEIRG
jgi:hypothetical protein